eukprot:Hpha_TRINITY_DN26309_c0_g1::TRINITY_DN26309_c0_g1_i1::g.9290::m.9290/K10428/DCTN6; dynactin 6
MDDIPNNIVCSTAKLEGPHPIQMRSRNIVHPLAKLRALNGPIELGEGNIIEETAEIVNELPQVDGEPPPVLRIGSFNLLEPGATLRAKRVGDSCAFRARSVVGLGSVIGDDCVVCARREVLPGDELAPRTVIWGRVGERRLCTEGQVHAAGHRQEVEDMVEELRKNLVVHHRLQK